MLEYLLIGLPWVLGLVTTEVPTTLLRDNNLFRSAASFVATGRRRIRKRTEQNEYAARATHKEPKREKKKNKFVRYAQAIHPGDRSHPTNPFQTPGT
ncbi:hypothetical protein VTH06DRAFT_1712 [Thermothelomyces fergusii]